MSLETLKFPFDHKLTLPSEPVVYLQCQWHDIGDVKSTEENVKYTPPFSISPVKLTEIKQLTSLTKCDKVKQKIEVILNVNNFECSYFPGDTIGIYPTNPSSEVDALIKLLNLDDKASSYFKIAILKDTKKKNAMISKYIPEITTIRHLLSKCLEIRTPVKKLFLRSIHRYTENEREKRRLEELSSREGSEEYTKYILTDNVSLLDLLKTFKTCKPPISLLLEHLPAIKPRVYSIASSPLTDNGFLRIVLTVVENGDGSKGVCSGWIYDISKSMTLEDRMKGLNINHQNLMGHKIPVFFRQANSFRYPENPSTNQILIGPGSGVAPFIGFLEHKRALMQRDKLKTSDSTQTWLFFGCRNESDYIFRKEMNEFLSEGILTKLFVSFSRTHNTTESPKYVQDSILQVKVEFITLLMKNETTLYICGDAQNMVKDVMSIIKTCLHQVRDLQDDEADEVIKEFSNSGKIVTDSWI